MRVMAVDHGSARTGLAVSDQNAALVGEAWVLSGVGVRQLKAEAQVIVNEAISREVDVIVVGHPKNMDGSEGPSAEKSSELAEMVREQCGNGTRNIEVVLWDERLTTVSAHKILSDAGVYRKKRKNTVDAVAASLILEGYLQYIRSHQQ